MDSQWTDQDDLGDPQLDAEHRAMFGLVQAIDAAEPSAATALQDTLEDLARRHFEAEEGRMAASGYYGLAAHRAEHRQMLATLQDLRGRPAPPAAELTASLLRHIRETDRSFALFLRRRG